MRLIIGSFTYVLPDGRGLPKMAGLDRDDYISGYREMTSAGHERGGKIALQLVHSGAQTKTKSIEGKIPLAPSTVSISPSARFCTTESAENAEKLQRSLPALH